MTLFDKPALSRALPYILPFGLFALLTYSAPVLNISPSIIYPLKTILVALCLAWFWKSYKSEIRVKWDLPAVAAGILVFIVWIGIDGYYPQFSQSGSSSPEQLNIYGNVIFLVIRMIGAVLVVPVMEELFWRSFAMRFLIESDFTKIRLGHFTWFSFIAVSVAFGFEHHRWLPGIIAGAAYAGTLYRTRNLFSPILAHAVTNLLLGIYVMATGRWEFW